MKKSAIIFLGVAATSLVICGICLLLYSNSSGVLYEKGLTAMLTGRYDEAQEYMQRVVDKNDARRGDAYYALAQCEEHRGDTTAYLEYLHQAALDMNEQAAGEYLTYLESDWAANEEYVSFLTRMHELSPDNYTYAWKLAFRKMILQEFDTAAVLLQPYVSLSGTALPGAGVEAKILAAALMIHGQGGYVRSPEGAVMLANSCRNVMEDANLSEYDSVILSEFGMFELLDLAYTPESNIIENISRAKRYFSASGEAMQLGFPHPYAAVLDDYLDEASRVAINPLWWERRPQDWKSYTNDSGFRYIGHTVGSGNKNYHDGMPDRPYGKGCGVDNRQHIVYIGKWGGNPAGLQSGLIIRPDGSIELVGQ